MLKNELINVRRMKNILKQRLNSIRDEMNRLEEEAYERGTLTRADISLVREWLMYYEEEASKLEEEISKLEEEEREILERFLQTRKDKKTLEKLKDRRLAEFLREEDRKSKKGMDEVAERKFWWGT